MERTNWVNFTDKHGVASLPLSQTLHLKTDNYEVTLEFTSDTSAYNRLLFPRQVERAAIFGTFALYQYLLFSHYAGICFL